MRCLIRLSSRLLVVALLGCWLLPGCSDDDGQIRDGGGGDRGSVDGPAPDRARLDAPGPDGRPKDAPSPDKPVVDLPSADSPRPDMQTAPSHSWNPMPTPSKIINLNALFGAGPRAIFAVGDSGTVLRHDGRKRDSGPSWIAMASGSSAALRGVWGSSEFDMFAVGDKGKARRFNGAAWSASATGVTKGLRGVGAMGAAAVFALGDAGTLLELNRTAAPNTWGAVKAGTTASLLAAAGGAKELVVVGSGGTILRYDGKSWVKSPSPTSEHLTGVWGSGGKYFAVGAKGTILSGGAAGWKKMKSPTGVLLNGVWGSALSNVWAVGDQGTILHYNGSAWSKYPSGTAVKLRAIWGAAADNIFAAGDKGTILQYAPCDCKVGGQCYRKGEVGQTGCKACDPVLSPSTLSLSAGACTISGKCYAKGEQDPSRCKICDPTKSKTVWTSSTGVCAVGGVCHGAGTKGPASCQVCSPGKSAKAWTISSGGCLIGGKCLAGGAKDVTGCATCNAAKSQTAWTISAGKCVIGGKCYASGATTSGGCATCDPAKSQTAWTYLGCPRPARKITFALGGSEQSMTLYTILTDGTGLTKVPGFGSISQRWPLSLPWSALQAGYNRDQARMVSSGGGVDSSIRLPGGKGRLRWYADNLANKVGVLHVKPDGTIKALHNHTGSYISDMNEYFAVSPKGTFAAGTVKTPAKLILLRTDGKLFPGGKSSLLWPLSPAAQFQDNNVAVTEKAAYLVTCRISSCALRNLWRVPTDGSKPQVVVLPVTGGAHPARLERPIAISREGGKVAVLAGSAIGSLDVVVIDEATGKAINLSKKPGSYLAHTNGWPSLAFSTMGTHIAYVGHDSSSKEVMWVRRSDGSGTPYEISSAANFKLPRRFWEFNWIDDDTLLFMVWNNSSRAFFRYVVSKKELLPLSPVKSAKKPYELNSTNYFIYQHWLSPNKAFLYYTVKSYESPQYYGDMNMHAVNLKTRALTKVTDTSVYIKSNPLGKNFCTNGPKVYFTLDDGKASSYKMPIYWSNMNAGTKSSLLAQVVPAAKNNNWISSFYTSHDCKLVFFTAGSYQYEYTYLVKSGPPPKLVRLAPGSLGSKNYAFRDMMLTKDGTQLVYVAGSKGDTGKLYVAGTKSGACCGPKMIHAGPAGAHRWRILHVN